MSSLRRYGQELRVSAVPAPHVPLRIGSSLYTLIPWLIWRWRSGSPVMPTAEQGVTKAAIPPNKCFIGLATIAYSSFLEASAASRNEGRARSSTNRHADLCARGITASELSACIGRKSIVNGAPIRGCKPKPPKFPSGNFQRHFWT